MEKIYEGGSQQDQNTNKQDDLSRREALAEKEKSTAFMQSMGYKHQAEAEKQKFENLKLQEQMLDKQLDLARTQLQTEFLRFKILSAMMGAESIGQPRQAETNPHVGAGRTRTTQSVGAGSAKSTRSAGSQHRGQATKQK